MIAESNLELDFFSALRRELGGVPAWQPSVLDDHVLDPRNLKEAGADGY
jgi:hypothetical protein